MLKTMIDFKKEKAFVLISFTLTYAYTELELHFKVQTGKFEFKYYSTDSVSIQHLDICLRVF
jgi:hypothetical protein